MVIVRLFAKQLLEVLRHCYPVRDHQTIGLARESKIDEYASAFALAINSTEHNIHGCARETIRDCGGDAAAI